MNPLNPFAMSGLLIAIFNFPLLVLLLKNGKTPISRIYAMHIFSVFLWGAGAVFIGCLKNLTHIIITWGIAYTGVLFIPVFFYHSVFIITKDTKIWKIIFCYIQAIILLILISITAIKHPQEVFFPFHSMYFHKATAAYTSSFILWLIIVSFSHINLYNYYRTTYPEEKNQLRSLLWAIAGFLGGVTNFLPAYGISIYPYGNFLVPLHSLFVTYSILRHQLFEIKIVIKKSLVYSMLILLVALLYFLTVFLCEKFLQNFWGYKSITISIATAFLVGILFFPLHNYIQRLVDKLIFKKTTEEISKENELLRAEVLNSEKLKSVAVLASGMAHEIKNPLTALKTFSEYLPNKLDDKEFLQKFSRIVGGEVNRIDELVNELLEFARPAPIQLKKTNVNKLIADTLDFLNSKFLQQKITVKTDLSPECDAPIMLDPNKIRQALLNIILNAIDAMPKGGVLAVVTHVQPPASSVQISLTDTGCGIEKDKLVTIFDPFYSTKDSGTGLGLPITHSIIKDHHGEIQVESVVGQGTTFTIVLPRADQNS